MPNKSLFSVAVFFLAAFAAVAVADMGRLKGVLDTGASDGWEARFDAGSYWLDNPREDGAVRYYYAPHASGDGGHRTVSVEVSVDSPNPNSRAGLLYGFDSRTRHYFLLVLGRAGQFDIYRRDASGFNLRMSSSTDAGGGFNRIEVRENGREIAFSVNGADLGSIGNGDVGSGALGIAAVGVGRFGFRNYRESSMPQGDLPGPSAAAAAPATASMTQPPRSAPAPVTPEPARAAAPKLRWLPAKDPQSGMWISRMPLPEDWNATAEGLGGPGGAQMKEVMGGTFEGGGVTMDQIIEGRLLPLLKQSGNRITRIEDQPQLARLNKEHQALYWTVTPTRTQHAVKSIEYEDDQGLKGLIIVHFTQMTSQFSALHQYYMHILESPAAQFASSKAVALHALANKQLNPEYLAVVNQREQQRAATSNQQFNQRQRQRQQQFDSWMATQRQTSSAALDSGMESWRRRQGMVDAGQERLVDSIGGNTQVVHPGTGESWKVEDGHNRYYMNNDGQYIPTDSYFYNPNMDPGMNNQEWTEVTPGAYGGR